MGGVAAERAERNALKAESERAALVARPHAYLLELK